MKNHPTFFNIFFSRSLDFVDTQTPLITGLFLYIISPTNLLQASKNSWHEKVSIKITQQRLAISDRKSVKVVCTEQLSRSRFLKLVLALRF